jgi:hypothetical protein
LFWLFHAVLARDRVSPFGEAEGVELGENFFFFLAALGSRRADAITSALFGDLDVFEGFLEEEVGAVEIAGDAADDAKGNGGACFLFLCVEGREEGEGVSDAFGLLDGTLEGCFAQENSEGIAAITAEEIFAANGLFELHSDGA